MAEEIVFNLVVDSKGAEKTIGNLESDIEKLRAEIENEPIGTERFNELGRAIQKTEAAIKDVDLQFEALDFEQKLTAGSDAIVGVAGGFAAAEGAAALFGVQSEALEESLTKVAGALAFTQGLRDLANGVIAFRKLGGVTKIYNALAQARNVIEATYSTILDLIRGKITLAAAAQQVWNFAIKANPIGAVVIAITALIAAITALIFWYKESGTAAEKSLDLQIKKSKDLQTEKEAEIKLIQEKRKQTEETNKLAIRGLEREIKLAKARNATEEELIKLNGQLEGQRKAALNQRGRSLNQEGQALVDQIKQIKEETKARREVINEQKATRGSVDKELLDEQKASIERAKELSNEFKQIQSEAFNVSEDIKDLEAQKEIDRLDKEESERQKRANASQKNRETEAEKRNRLRRAEIEAEELQGVELARVNQETIDILQAQNRESAERNLEIDKNVAAARRNVFFELAQLEQQLEQERLDAIAESEAKRQEQLGIAQQGLDALSAGADAFIKDEEKRAKVQKAIAVAQVALDTAKAVSAGVAQAAAVPFPANIPAILTTITAVLAGIAQAKQALGSANASVNLPSAGSSGGSSGARLNNISNTQSLVNQDQQQIEQRVVVLESDITTAQDNNTNIADLATF